MLIRQFAQRRRRILDFTKVMYCFSSAALAPSPSSERIVIAAIQAKGVPDLSAEEALWTVIEILREER